MLPALAWAHQAQGWKATTKKTCGGARHSQGGLAAGLVRNSNLKDQVAFQRLNRIFGCHLWLADLDQTLQ